MASEVWHELFTFDSRIFKSFSLPVAKPGRLTIEYLAGRLLPWMGVWPIVWIVFHVYLLPAGIQVYSQSWKKTVAKHFFTDGHL